MEIPLPKCKTHDGHTCEFYCVQCGAVICRKCLVSFHNKHGVEDLEDLCKARREIIAQERETVRTAVSLYQHLDKDVAIEEDRIREKYAAIENEIRQHGEKLEEAGSRQAGERRVPQACEGAEVGRYQASGGRKGDNPEKPGGGAKCGEGVTGVYQHVRGDS